MRIEGRNVPGPQPDPAGVLVVNKDKGMTSHDVVDIIRKRFGFRKVGHAGTLDPNATGVLVMLIGKGTKLSNSFMSEDKEYTARMKLGERTDSGDSDGKIISCGEVRVTEAQVKKALSGFEGEIEQVPPMVSAKKVGGRKLYKLARQGVQVKREPRKVVIEEIEVTAVDIPIVEFRVVCGKGTYIRQIADDLGQQLGCGAHLTELCRTRSGSFTLKQALPVSRLKEMDMDGINESIIRVQGAG